MKKIIYLLLFVLVYMMRWVSVGNPLPNTWTQESKISFTTTVLESPQYSDSKTIIRKGNWYIPLKGYVEIIPGSRVRFEGVAQSKVILGKISQVEMKDPSIEVVGVDRECIVCRLRITLDQYRNRWIGTLQKTLPEPMASLAAGILLGIKAQMPQEFYEALKETGTLHMIAASGYNVAIVVSVLMMILAKFASKKISIMIGIIGIVFYVLISGGSASVIRAGIMGSLTLIAYYFGRPTEARRLLWVTLMIMLLSSPLMIFDIGFQLSAMATIGLLYIGHTVSSIGNRFIAVIKLSSGIGDFLAEYLYPTLAATVVTLPIILWHFGRVSWISPLVNMLILPFVPLIMLLTTLTLVAASFSLVLGQLVAWLAYVPLAWMVWVIWFFGGL